MNWRREQAAEIKARADRIKSDVANPSLRFLARCETNSVGGYGECLLCEAEQGERSSFCIREVQTRLSA